GNRNLMIYPIVPMIQDMVAIFSLQAGDRIMFGTPAGVGRFEAGDEIVRELVGQTPLTCVGR
ncbi:fumarylacetoacetate hydrolase family protein, partial [Pseudomonas syringae pv. tagetis]|uniref:fumarylacetoacetate hydrolase family protein n=1 Tax=Pseudomonas syringae group genomosp. 7 TaxID=251699 RepID=UPI00376FD275